MRTLTPPSPVVRSLPPRFGQVIQQTVSVPEANFQQFQRKLLFDCDLLRRELTQRLGHVWGASQIGGCKEAGEYCLRQSAEATTNLLKIQFTPRGGWLSAASSDVSLTSTLTRADLEKILKHFQQ